MKKQKIFILLQMMLLLFSVFYFTDSVCASTSVKICKKNFPDKYFREIINKKFDSNKDGYLSKKEREKVNKLVIDKSVLSLNYDYCNYDIYKKKVQEKLRSFKLIDCKGLQYFKNLEELKLVVDCSPIDGMQPEIKNLNLINKLRKLKVLTINGDESHKKYDFSNFNSLQSIEISCSNAKRIIACNCNKLKKVNISINYYLTQINLKNASKLKKVICNSNCLNSIVLPSNNKIALLDLRANNFRKFSTKNLSRKFMKNLKLATNPLKKLDVSKLKGLKKLSVYKKTIVIKKKKQNIEINKSEYSIDSYLNNVIGIN